MKHFLILYICTLLVTILLDGLWIGVIAKDFYSKRIPDLEFHTLPAVLFYLVYAFGIVIFVNGKTGISVQDCLLYGALFGFIAYSTYDLTNLATLKNWSVSLCLVDMAWGCLVTAASSSVAMLIARYCDGH